LTDEAERKRQEAAAKTERLLIALARAGHRADEAESQVDIEEK
jgi:hypothetical protein